MSEKKRKRDSEAAERPKKKAATEPSAPTGTVKVKFVTDNDGLSPVFASTPGLALPHNVPLEAYKKDLISDRRIIPPNMKDQPLDELLLHTSAHPKMDYTAREEQAGGAEGHLKHYVGVYDPATGELQVMEARRLVVRTTLRSELEEMRQANEQKRATGSSLRQELGMAFGTKKAKKAIASLTENAINPNGRARSPADIKADPIASALLDSMAATTENMPTRQELNAAIDEAKPRPKANLAAETPAEVYPLSNLISADEMKFLSMKSWEDAEKSEGKIETHSRFVNNRVWDILKRKDTKLKKALKYVETLVNFWDVLPSGRNEGKKVPKSQELAKKLPGVAPELINSIRRKFTSDFAMNREQRDLLFTHIAALTLIIDNFETDIHDLQQDLKLQNVANMRTYFREIGARVSGLTTARREKLKLTRAEASTHQLAKLQLPLEFPKVSVPKSKRR